MWEWSWCGAQVKPLCRPAETGKAANIARPVDESRGILPGEVRCDWLLDGSIFLEGRRGSCGRVGMWLVRDVPGVRESERLRSM